MGRYQMPWNFRDVSSGLAKIREFLLGRKFVNHHRFPPLIAPRSIPPPDVPRGPDYKYSDQYYGDRNALNSVKPPVVAPVAIGASGRKIPPGQGGHLKFPSELPTPGCVWWFDAHCYYKEEFQTPCGPTPKVPGPPIATSPCPCPQPKSPPGPPKEATVVKAVKVEKTICELEPSQRRDTTPKLSPGVCDPCCEDEKKKKC